MPPPGLQINLRPRVSCPQRGPGQHGRSTNLGIFWAVKRALWQRFWFLLCEPKCCNWSENCTFSIWRAMCAPLAHTRGRPRRWGLSTNLRHLEFSSYMSEISTFRHVVWGRTLPLCCSTTFSYLGIHSSRRGRRHDAGGLNNRLCRCCHMLCLQTSASHSTLFSAVLVC